MVVLTRLSAPAALAAAKKQKKPAKGGSKLSLSVRPDPDRFQHVGKYFDFNVYLLDDRQNLKTG